MNLDDDDIYLNGGVLNLERQLDHKQSVKDISVHGERQKIVVTLEFAQKLLPLFGRRSIPSGVVARPRSMRSPRALPDRCLSTQKGEVILARTLLTNAY